MSLQRKLRSAVQRRKLRVRASLDKSLPRVSIFRSLQHIYAQIIDDQQHHTLVSCSSQELKNSAGSQTDIARAVGKELAQRALSAGIQVAVFDRGSCLFHGRVRALAEGAREAGLRI